MSLVSAALTKLRERLGDGVELVSPDETMVRHP
jgi:hypothetical protein